MKLIDLHVHSTCSDGTLTPKELVRHAAKCGLSALALTDHDNTDGISEAMEAAASEGIELIPGIEFSTEYQGIDIHIVGLDIDWTSETFCEKVKYYSSERLRRNKKMISLMAADGIDITYDKMCAAFGEGIWTRAHLGRYLMEHGYVEQISDAFAGYIGEGCKYYVPREKVHPADVTRLIRQAGGIPVLAHPFQYRFSDEQLRALLQTLIPAGLLGMEVHYSTHSADQTEYLKQLTQELSLAPGGGSDFHGSNKPTIALGTGKDNLQIPYSVLEGLRKKQQEAFTP